MNLICLDMEGVLTPEIWIAFADAAGIPELRRTTREEPDYGKLMNDRLRILEERGLGLNEIRKVVDGIDLLPGAKEFLDSLRAEVQTVILSDTFDQFAMPLLRKMGYPLILCNTLKVSETGAITGYTMRVAHSKLTAVNAFQSIGYATVAVGDSYNDLEMIRQSKAGFLFRTTEEIAKANPGIPAFTEYEELKNAILEAL